MNRLEEVTAKIESLRAMMTEEELDCIVLGGATNFSWITAGGDDVVALASERGAAAVVVTQDNQYVVTDNIEAGRLADEELVGLEFQILQDEWHRENFVELLERAVVGEVGADGSWLPGASDFNPEINQLRWSLLEPEIERYRMLWGGGLTLPHRDRAAGAAGTDRARDCGPAHRQAQGPGDRSQRHPHCRR